MKIFFPDVVVSDHKLWRLWWGTLVLKILLGIWSPFLLDETYYWFWSHFPQLSYYDHPPFVAWIFWLGQFVGGFHQSERLVGIVLGHCTSLIWLALGIQVWATKKNELRSDHLSLLFLLLLLNPLLFFSSVLITPDLPLLFFWSLSLLCFANYLRRPSAPVALALGLSLGLGFCSKYHIVLFFPAIVLVLLWKRSRIPVSHFLITTAAFLAASLPVWLWNYDNNFDSFLFQLRHGLGRSDWKFSWSTTYLVGQVALLLPTVLWGFFVGIKKHRTLSDTQKVLLVFGAFPLCFFFLTSFRGVVEANWPLVAYPSIILLAAFYLPRRQILWSISVWATLLALICSHVLGRWIPIPEVDQKIFETEVYKKYLPLAENSEPLYASSYQMASAMSFLSGKFIFKFAGIGRRDFFDYRPEAYPDAPRIFLLKGPWDEFPEWAKSIYQLQKQTHLEGDLYLWEMVKK